MSISPRSLFPWHGSPETCIRSAYSTTLPQFGRYLWLMSITSFVAWMPTALLYIGYIGFVFLYVRPKVLLGQPNSATNPEATFLLGLVSIAFFLLVIPVFGYGIVMTLRYALALPACVVGNLKARAAESSSSSC